MLNKNTSKDRDILYKKFENCINEIFYECLSLMEIFIDDEEQFKKLRSKFLRVGNNKRRFMKRLLMNYIIEYKPIQGERVQFSRDEVRDKAED